MRSLSWFVLLTGGCFVVICLLIWRFVQIQQSTNVVYAATSSINSIEAEKRSSNSLDPAILTIPRLDIRLQVRPATVDENEWMIFEDAASWLVTSGNLVTGNTVVYAHNNTHTFAELEKLEAGDEIILSNETTSVVFRVEQGFEGKSSDTQYVTESKNRLTLYTCSGPFDLYRYFVLAQRVRIE